MWSASEVAALRNELRLDPAEFARLCGVDVRTVSRWELGESRPTGASEAVLDGVRHALVVGQSQKSDMIALLARALAVGGLAYLLAQLLADPPRGPARRQNRRKKRHV